MAAASDTTREGTHLTTHPYEDLWLPSMSPQRQKKLKHFRKKNLSKRLGIADKTLWDWLQLLLIPLVLALLVTWLNIRQAQISDLATEEHQQEGLLVTYERDISALLLSKDNSLMTAPQNAPVATVAQAMTTTALYRLRQDPDRQGLLVQFLYNVHLIMIHNPAFPDTMKEPQIYLSSIRDKIDLSTINLENAYLNNANLWDTRLCGARLKGANLEEAYLEDADLEGADLEGADLEGAKLEDANLNYANLKNATGVDIVRLERETRSLHGTIMPDGSLHS